MAINNVTDVQNITNVSKNSSTKKSTSNSNSVSFDSYTKKKYTYSDIFKAASKKYNISQELLEAVALTESSFRPNATSYCGAMGIMQLMPATAKSLGVSDAYNPVENIMGGAKYLSQMMKKYKGNVSLTLAAYNGGPGNVAKYGGVPSFCKSYVNKVTNYMKKGVDVPNKSITVDTASKAGALMADYSTVAKSVSNKTNSSTSVDKVSSTVNKNADKYQKYHSSQLHKVSPILNDNVAISSANSLTYSDLFKYAADKYNISQDLLEALAFAESNFDANATSRSGAMGIMQLMPATAKSLGVSNAYNPIENVLGGAKYLSQMLKRYNGNEALAIAGYNGGMGNVAKYGGVPPFCQSFVNKVLKYADKGVTVPNTSLKTASNYSSDADANILANKIQELYKNEKNLSNEEKSKILQSLINKYGSYDNILAMVTKMSINANNSYDLVDMLDSINDYYV